MVQTLDASQFGTGTLSALTGDLKALDDACHSCGEALSQRGSTFCPRCGQRRPPHSCELQGLMDALQAGATRGVFDKVRDTLLQSAEAAVAGMNTNIKMLANTMPERGGLAAVESIGPRRAAELKGAQFTVHVGYHSNQQIICHLLHLVVQLALFPHKQTFNFTDQKGCALNELECNGMQAAPTMAETETQTPPPPAPPPPPPKVGPHVGVRIGGGYHLFPVPSRDDQQQQQQQQQPQSPAQHTVQQPTEPTSPGKGGTKTRRAQIHSEPPGARRRDPSADADRPLLGELAEETLTITSDWNYVLQRPQGPTEEPTMLERELRARQHEPTKPTSYLVEAPKRTSTFALGARSESTPRDKFRIGAYTHGGHLQSEAVLESKDAMINREGEGIQLCRYLHSSPRANNPSPRGRKVRGQLGPKEYTLSGPRPRELPGAGDAAAGPGGRLCFPKKADT